MFVYFVWYTRKYLPRYRHSEKKIVLGIFWYIMREKTTENGHHFFMLSISRSEHLKILHHIDSGKNARQIASITRYHHSTISKIWSIHRPHVPKSRGGRPPTLTPQDLRHAIRLIISRKVDNCVQVAHSLRTITGKSFSPETIRLRLKAQGLKAVVKKKRPLLSKVHWRARLDWAIAHQHWTLEDWKRVVWSDETKVNRLGSDGQQWVWKKIGEGLSDWFVEETLYGRTGSEKSQI